MLDVAFYKPPGGATVPFDVGFTRPDTVVLDGMVHSTDYAIEYQAVDVKLQRGDMLRIGGINYKVRQTPRAKADGSFYVAVLEEVPA